MKSQFTGRWFRTYNNGWAVKVSGPVAEGDIVTVRKKNNETEDREVSHILWTGPTSSAFTAKNIKKSKSVGDVRRNGTGVLRGEVANLALDEMPFGSDDFDTVQPYALMAAAPANQPFEDSPLG